MYLGPFYFNTKEIFLVLALVLLSIAVYLDWNIMFFDKTELLTLGILALLVKGLLPAIHNEPFFIVVLFCIFMSLFLPLFQVILFYFLCFGFFKALKVI